MRIVAYFTKNTIPVPVVNQTILNGYIHKCLGKDNTFHDTFSDYSISSLYGGKLENNNINFNKFGLLIITSKNLDFLDKIINGLNKYPDFEWGMKLDHVNIFPNEKYVDGFNYFHTLSPIIFKGLKPDGTINNITVNDIDFDEKLTTKTKLKLLHYVSEKELEGFKIESTKSDKEKVKKTLVRGYVNVGSQCNLKITSSRKIAELLFNLGLGKSTGSGFGCICKTENIKLYK